MKSISAALAQHLAGEVTTLATCWQITRRDGVALGFTDHVRDLVVDSVTFNAASGYTRTATRCRRATPSRSAPAATRASRLASEVRQRRQLPRLPARARD
jgi:hypothetical protein